jgi:hypothetical protein
MQKTIVGGVLLLVVAGCSGSVLPQESSIGAPKFTTFEQVMTSYDDIKLGQTRRPDLTALGLDTQTTPNIEVLSYNQILDLFLPNETLSLKQAPVGVQRCLRDQDHCSAYIYRLDHSHARQTGGVVPELLGTEHNTYTSGWKVEIVLLLQGDVVVYKVMSGQPNMQDNNDKSQPLGPLQDLGQSIVGSQQ